MSKDNKEKKNREYITRKYRITIIDDDSHENLFVFKATKFVSYSILTLLLLCIIALVYVVIAYTPFRETIPGYPSASTKKAFVENVLKVDSLEREIRTWSIYLDNIQRVIKGEETIIIDSTVAKNIAASQIRNRKINSDVDSLLKDEVTRIERNTPGGQGAKIDNIDGLLFFTPVKGIITQYYDKAGGHPFLDIAVAESSPVSAILDGTIISAAWNDETGYTIQIQHDNDLISVYKHNVSVLKKSGDKVTAGTPIALAGNAGSISTGPHLHFELWHKGEAIDPVNYIKF